MSILTTSFGWARIDNDDTIMRLLALPLEGQVKDWYYSLPHEIATDYNNFEGISLEIWRGIPHEE